MIVTDVFTVSAAVSSESSEVYPSGSPIYVSIYVRLFTDSNVI